MPGGRTVASLFGVQTNRNRQSMDENNLDWFSHLIPVTHKLSFLTGSTVVSQIHVWDRDPIYCHLAPKRLDKMKRDTVQTDNQKKINRTDWFDHFHKLLTPENNQYGNDRKENVEDELSDYEKLNQTCN